MTRRVLKFSLVAATALLLAFAANETGHIELDWFGWTARFHPVFALGGMIALLAFWHYAGAFWTWLQYRSGLFGAARKLRRQRAARASSAAALSAFLFGQQARAKKLAAEALANDPEDWTAGAIAAFCGNETEIERLLGDEATRPLATLARFRLSPSLQNAEAAATAAPASSAAWQAVTEARARELDYRGAEAALSNWHALDPDLDSEARWIGAALAFAAAEDARQGGDPDKARSEALRALKLEPKFVPAAMILADLSEAGDRAVEKAVHKTWTLAPHPSLLKAYVALEPLADDTAQLARVETLIAGNRDHPESQLALARYALAAGEPSRALETLSAHLDATAPRDEAIHLALDAYRHLGINPPAHAAWVDTTGSIPPAWHCRACNAAAVKWSLECARCDRIGTLVADGTTEILLHSDI